MELLFDIFLETVKEATAGNPGGQTGKPLSFVELSRSKNRVGSRMGIKWACPRKLRSVWKVKGMRWESNQTKMIHLLLLLKGAPESRALGRCPTSATH